MATFFSMMALFSTTAYVYSHEATQQCVYTMEHMLEKITKIGIKVEEIGVKVGEIEKRMSVIEAQQNVSVPARIPNVAFRAILSKDVGKVTTGMVIVFDQVDLNSGSAYGPRHGFFTAPYNGTYLFSMHLGNPAGKPGAFFMKKNGKGIEYAIAGHTTGWNMGGVTTVAELSVDDQMWVEGEGYISGAYATARYHTSFSGMLLHAHGVI